MTMSFYYQSGEEAKVGDRVKHHGEPGQVELVATELTGSPETDWYIQEFPPGGIMIVSEAFGRVFLREGEEHEDLEFVGRNQI
jgi:hypothetical protein